MALEGFWPADGEVRVSGCFVATVTCGDKDLVEVLVERGSLPKRCCAYVGPKVRIRLPPALSYGRTRLPRSVGRLASTCGYHCPLGGSGLPGCGCPYAGHLGCFPSGSIGAARSLQVMIFVIPISPVCREAPTIRAFPAVTGVIVVRERPVGGGPLPHRPARPSPPYCPRRCRL